MANGSANSLASLATENTDFRTLTDRRLRAIANGSANSLASVPGGPKQVSASIQTGVQDRRLQAVLQLAQDCEYEVEHTHQVTRLALRLFDELGTLHGLGAEERFWLRCGALLHDIGLIKGARGHHKTALRIILDTPLLPFDARERLIVGSIARYHRKALPQETHAHFAALDPADQDSVSTLAALLRVADGLDYTHQSLVQDISCETAPRQIIVRCGVRRAAEVERQRALYKGNLLEQVLNRELVVEWRLV
ncbi:MAG: HD domain-containing protein [Anaerolineae bacterium]|nr:HD domain-containing protein [Anaerolineae bacterium]